MMVWPSGEKEGDRSTAKLLVNRRRFCPLRSMIEIVALLGVDPLSCTVSLAWLDTFRSVTKAIC